MDTELNVPESPVVHTKPKAKKAAKPKAKKVTRAGKAAMKPKAKKARAKKKLSKRKPSKKSKPARPIVRTERLDMRLSKVEKAKVSLIAKKKKRTLTSIVYEAIEKLK